MYKITTVLKGEIYKYGIVNTKNGQILVEAEYDNIIKVFNYQNLSFRDFSIVYLLTIGALQKVCHIQNDIAHISDTEFDLDSINYFYKNLTICKQNYLDCIIDIYGNIILDDSSLPDDWNDLGEKLKPADLAYQLLYAHRHESFQEPMFSLYSWIKKSIFINSNSFYIEGDCCSKGRFPEFCYSLIYKSFVFDWIGDWDDETGLSLLKSKGKLAFINRELFIVGGWFDYLYSDLEISEAGLDINNKHIKYIGIEDKTFAIQFTGNLVEEFSQNPELFFEFKEIQTYFINKFNPIKNNIIEFNDRSYWKIDRELFKTFHDVYDNENLLKIGDCDIQEYVTENFKTISENLIKHVLTSTDLISNNEERINHLNLMGWSYSSYKIIDRDIKIIKKNL